MSREELPQRGYGTLLVPTGVPVEHFKPREGQVIGAKNIRIGARYLSHNDWDTDEGRPITVVGLPRQLARGPLFMKTVWKTNPPLFIDETYLCDLGVVPYNPDGSMNPTNFLTVDTGPVPDREWQMGERLSGGDSRGAAIVALVAAAEAEGPEEKVAYLKVFADLLRDAKLTLHSVGLSREDMHGILKRLYKDEMFPEEATALHEAVSHALSSFEGL